MQGFSIPDVNYPASKEPDMYRNTNDGQTSIYDFPESVKLSFKI